MNRDDVIAYIKEVKVASLATAGPDGGPRVRPIFLDDVNGDVLYFFTLAISRKVGELEANPRIEVAWTKPADFSQVRIVGTASPVKDEAIVQRWRAEHTMIIQNLPPGAERLVRLYQVRPEKVEVAMGRVPYTEVAW
jgi:general stress protein 26